MFTRAARVLLNLSTMTTCAMLSENLITPSSNRTKENRLILSYARTWPAAIQGVDQEVLFPGGALRLLTHL